MDECDRAQMSIETVIDVSLANAMRKALEIPVGNPGDCSYCGEWSGRLVNDACAPCRTRYKLD